MSMVNKDYQYVLASWNANDHSKVHENRLFVSWTFRRGLRVWQTDKQMDRNSGVLRRVLKCNVFTGRQHSSAICKYCISYDLDVCLSVCPSVRPPVRHTLTLWVKTTQAIGSGNLRRRIAQGEKDSSFRDKKFIQKFERVQPERWR